jgi:hypothetical protein
MAYDSVPHTDAEIRASLRFLLRGATLGRVVRALNDEVRARGWSVAADLLDVAWRNLDRSHLLDLTIGNHP